ncbi:MAG: class I SAM-dependent methyltransferase [Actinomycetota bacterium]
MPNPPSPPRDWYLQVAEHLGELYLGYEFTQGTHQEVEFLYSTLAMKPGDRVLDVGCGPGRHSVEMARRGLSVVGIDLSPVFVSLARERAADAGVNVSLFEMDALDLPFEDEFDAVISMCEGAFGLGLDDLLILRSMTRALKPGGHLAVGAPNLFYVLNHMQQADELDPVSMILTKTLKAVPGVCGERDLTMYNSCYTPRELGWIANGAGADPQFVSGVTPGDYRGQPPTAEHPELLLLARKPPVG